MHQLRSSRSWCKKSWTDRQPGGLVAQALNGQPYPANLPEALDHRQGVQRILRADLSARPAMSIRPLNCLLAFPEVVLKLLEHSLKHFATRSWWDFIPPKDMILAPGQDLAKCRLTPVNEMRILVAAPLLQSRRNIFT